ncbi:DUF7331 family protein [Haladaptatus sp. NG-SE-30]
MQNRPPLERIEQQAPDLVDLDRYASYEDGESTVICDRKNTNAWIRADVTSQLSP